MSTCQQKICSLFLITIFGFLFSVNPIVLAADDVVVELSLDASASAIGSTVQAGGYSADFNIIKINNASAYPVIVNWIKVTRSGGSADDFNSISLYSISSSGSRSQLGATQYLISSGVVYFDTVLNIPANSYIRVAVSASVPKLAKAGDVVTWNLASSDDVSVTALGSLVQPTVKGSSTGVSRTILGSGPDTTAPAAPSNMKVETVGTEPTLRVSWTDPTDTDLQKIVLYRSTVKSQAGVITHSFSRGSGISSVTLVDDKDIVVGTTYYYTLKAIDIAGNESVATTQTSGIVYSKGLNIFLDSSSPAATQINASTSDVTLGAFKFLASNTDATVTSLKFAGISADQISKLKLYVDGTLVSSSTSVDFIFYNDSSRLSIPANTSKIISVRGDIPPGAYSGDITVNPASLTAQGSNGLSIITYGLKTAANKITVKGTTPPLMPLTSSSPTPSASPSATPTPSSASTAGIPEGALIRAIGDIDVYIVKYMGAKKFKRLVLSPSVFNNYGHLKWSDIRDIDPSVANAFTVSELVRAVGDEKVYKLYPAGDSGQKRWIKNATVFSTMGFDTESIYEINSFDRDSYTTGSDLE